MASTRPQRSRAFFVTSTLVLSFAYLAVAAGLWLVQSGGIETTAETISSTVACTPASQVTDGFNESKVVSGGGIPVPTGWTADSGTILYGVDRNISRDDNGDAWMAIQGRIVRPTRETLSGTATFKLSTQFGYGGSSSPILPYDVTLLTKSGSPLTVRFAPASTVPNTPVQYRDPLTGEFKPVENAQTISNPFSGGQLTAPFTIWGGGVRENTFSSDTTFTVSWDGTSFTLESPNTIDPIINGPVIHSKTYRYSQNDPTAITGIALTGQAGVAASPTMNLLAQSVTYPAGTSGPCLTGLAPNQGPGGTEVTLTGTQFETSGMSVTLKPTTGETITLRENLTINPEKTTLKFKVPMGTPLGPYQVGLISSTGPSGQTFTFTVTDSAAPPTPSTLSLAVDPTSGLAPLSVTATATGIPPMTATNTACAAGATTAPLTESFDSFKDGDTAFGWTVTAHPDTTVAVKTTAGKSGNGLELLDRNANAGYANQAELSRAFKEQAVGSLSFDVQPKQTTGRFQVGFFTKDGQDGGLVYLAPGGTFQYWDYQTPGGYVGVGSKSYTANQWTNLKLSWKGTTYDVFVDGEKLNASPLPFLYRGRTASLVNNTQLVTGWGGSDTGTFWIDNVSLPGCSSDPLLTWEFGDGSAPLVGTATTVTHTYETAGTYTLRVSSGGQTVTQTITASAAPGQPAPTPEPKAQPPAAPPAPTPPQSGPPSGGGTPAPPTAPSASKPAALVSSGGNLFVNLGIALFLSLLTGYVLLRRGHPGRSL